MESIHVTIGNNLEKLKESAQKVQRQLAELGYTNRVMELPESTRTAQEAAADLISGRLFVCSGKRICFSYIYHNGE